LDLFGSLLVPVITVNYPGLAVTVSPDITCFCGTWEPCRLSPGAWNCGAHRTNFELRLPGHKRGEIPAYHRVLNIGQRNNMEYNGLRNYLKWNDWNGM
jgi:hypothetical protein